MEKLYCTLSGIWLNPSERGGQIVETLGQQAAEEGFEFPMTQETWNNGILCTRTLINADSESETQVESGLLPPKSGDILLFKIISKDGRYKEIELELALSKSH